MKKFVVTAVLLLACSLTTYGSDIICDTHNEGKFFPDYDDCSNYYLCHKGVLVVGSCLEGLSFNFEAQSCEISNKSCMACPGNGVSHVRHYESCHKYYFCAGKDKKLMSCPSGLYFNPKTGHCDFASAVDCDEPCPKQTPIPVFMSYKGSCRTYKICFDGEQKMITCPKGLFFNPTTKSCDTKKTFDCLDEDHSNAVPIKKVEKTPPKVPLANTPSKPPVVKRPVPPNSLKQ